jgi:hypothetical protein
LLVELLLDLNGIIVSVGVTLIVSSGELLVDPSGNGVTIEHGDMKRDNPS